MHCSHYVAMRSCQTWNLSTAVCLSYLSEYMVQCQIGLWSRDYLAYSGLMCLGHGTRLGILVLSMMEHLHRLHPDCWLTGISMAHRLLWLSLKSDITHHVQQRVSYCHASPCPMPTAASDSQCHWPTSDSCGTRNQPRETATGLWKETSRCQMCCDEAWALYPVVRCFQLHRKDHLTKDWA